jgi:flagellar M-ring protein FliF
LAAAAVLLVAACEKAVLEQTSPQTAEDYQARGLESPDLETDDNNDEELLGLRERWTRTGFEQNIKIKRTQVHQMIIDLIKTIDDVDDSNLIKTIDDIYYANLMIIWPTIELFRIEQIPVSASIIITPKPGSDITRNRKKIEGIQKLLKAAIGGLQDENIVIRDNTGVLLN